MRRDAHGYQLTSCRRYDRPISTIPTRRRGDFAVGITVSLIFLGLLIAGLN